MIERGYFRLYDRCEPALDAGDYRLKGDYQFSPAPDADADMEELNTHFRVRAARYKLPPDQVLSTFPPNNGEGSYEARLPQVVIRDRNLPWMRNAAPVGRRIKNQVVGPETPWLALVVIAEGEGEIVHDAPIADCITAGVNLSGHNDVGQGSYLNIGTSMVEKIFPTVEDLALLTHVREVNLDDTEAAMGDDDGFMAVIIANRFPQYDDRPEKCNPIRYTACLINLEGQLDTLPPKALPVFTFAQESHIDNEEVKNVVERIKNGRFGNIQVPSVNSTAIGRNNINTVLTEGLRRGDMVMSDGNLVARNLSLGGTTNVLGALSETDALAGDFSSIADHINMQPVFKTFGSFDMFKLPLDEILAEPLFRYPILTSWQFTCTGSGGFKQFMENLDVGLLGTVSEGGKNNTLPPCFEPNEGASSDDPPISHLPLEVAETGHVGMAHLTRIGETRNAWYRGPFSPVPLKRAMLPESDDSLLVHSSDQLRLVTPDGREDVSLAVAFETGRLLALSQLSFVSAVSRWRDDNFSRNLWWSEIVKNFGVNPDLNLNLNFKIDELDRFFREPPEIVARILEQVTSNLGKEPHFGFGPKIPIVQPGVPIDFLKNSDPAGIIEDGFGLEGGSVRAVMRAEKSVDLRAAMAGIIPDVLGNRNKFNRSVAASLDANRENSIQEISEVSFGTTKLEDIDLNGVNSFNDFETLSENFIKNKGELDR